MAETITVNIFNTEYKLKGDNSELMRDAAQLVDEQMRFVSRKAPMQPPVTTAVLAALNSAEQLLSERDRGHNIVEDLAARINALSDALDEVLDGDR